MSGAEATAWVDHLDDEAHEIEVAFADAGLLDWLPPVDDGEES